MVDCGEKVSATLKREFMEEAMDSLGTNDKMKIEVSKKLDNLFSNGVEVYFGYVNDPRNTDNAWMETVAYNFHDEKNDLCQDLKLTAGDDASHVTWMDIDRNLNLYANHKDFIEKTAKLHEAHW